MHVMVCRQGQYFLTLLLILVFSSHTFVLEPLAYSLPLVRRWCSDEESSALLHFKQSFVVDCVDASDPDFAHPKVKSWANGHDCCSWEGVECDEETGHVIGLELSSSCLYGKFPSNSSLFSLSHLQELNLDDNYFNSSPIPSELGRLTNLRSLNLSYSGFSGQVPLELSKLSQLSILDLSRSTLRFVDVSLEKFVQNFTRLTHLGLDDVDISSPVPNILANVTSLNYLSLSSCNLHGSLPLSIFGLPLLEEVYIYGNSALKGSLPQFQPNSHLRKIDVHSTTFYGQVPPSIGELARMEYLDLRNCSFSGPIPSSLGNLKKLTYLGLAENHFSGGVPSSLGNLKKLTYLGLGENHFSGGIPPSFANLTQLQTFSLTGMDFATEIPSFIANFMGLEYLRLDENQLIGQIPLWLMNLTQLQYLSLYQNHLKGPIPEEISQLVNLHYLSLSWNDNLHGNFGSFLKLKLLTDLELNGVNLARPAKATINESQPRFMNLFLDSCKLKEFPQFLRSDNELEQLGLSNNAIRGLIPQWFVNITRGSLYVLDLSYNSLTGFEHPVKMLPWNYLKILDLNGNQFQGSLPIPPTSMKMYYASSNQLVGSIPQQICLATSLIYLDVSNNTLGGQIPDCIGELANSLVVLNLRGNNFNGTIPRSYSKSCALKMINLSQNQLDGTIPRSLVNCNQLVVLDIGQNRVNDTFPSWLGSLPNLQVLVLRHNCFHGRIIDRSKVSSDFRLLRIVDLSHNFHTGDLPCGYLQIWDAMKIVEATQSSTSGTIIRVTISTRALIIEDVSFNYSIVITNKGSDRLYPKIWTFLRVIDFSSNSFTGKIPDSISELRGLEALNLSNNNLEGKIPSSLSNIRALESLDLSANHLSGRIPQELAQLTFLEVFNVSHNRLTGPIPQGTQFDTFDSSSFDGNPGLCGIQVPKKCGNVHHESPPSPPIVPGNDEEADSDVIDWIIRASGCVAGFVVGYVIGNYFTDRHHGWFVETFGKKRRTRKTRQRAPRRRT